MTPKQLSMTKSPNASYDFAFYTMSSCGKPFGYVKETGEGLCAFDGKRETKIGTFPTFKECKQALINYHASQIIAP